MFRHLLVTRGFGNGSLVGKIKNLVSRGFIDNLITTVNKKLEGLAFVTKDSEHLAELGLITEFINSLVAKDLDLSAVGIEDLEFLDTIISEDIEYTEVAVAQNIEKLSRVKRILERSSILLNMKEERPVDVSTNKEDSSSVAIDISGEADVAKPSELTSKSP